MARRTARWALTSSRSASGRPLASLASSPVLLSTAAVASSRPKAARERSFDATAWARLPAARERSRTRVRTAPPAAWIRREVTAIRRTALASNPESVG